MVLIVVISLVGLWWPRRAVWSVLLAGGTLQSAGGPPLNGRIQQLEFYMPTSLRPCCQWSATTIGPWLQLDRDVIHVDLGRAAVDHRWLLHLKPMTSLITLYLDQGQVGPELAALPNISQQECATVYNPRAETALEQFAHIPNLERLVLMNPQSSAGSLAQLGRHPSLRRLVLVGESVGWSNLLRQCDGWTNVNTFEIDSQVSLTSGLDGLRGCHSLRTLWVSAPLTDADLAALSQITQLTSLTMRNVAPKSRLTDGGWMMLQTLTDLRTLKIDSSLGNKLPIDELRKLLPNCTIAVDPGTPDNNRINLSSSS
jgi:hypothetical protein